MGRLCIFIRHSYNPKTTTHTESRYSFHAGLLVIRLRKIMFQDVPNPPMIVLVMSDRGSKIIKTQKNYSITTGH